MVGVVGLCSSAALLLLEVRCNGCHAATSPMGFGYGGRFFLYAMTNPLRGACFFNLVFAQALVLQVPFADEFCTLHWGIVFL